MRETDLSLSSKSIKGWNLISSQWWALSTKYGDKNKNIPLKEASQLKGNIRTLTSYVNDVYGELESETEQLLPHQWLPTSYNSIIVAVSFLCRVERLIWLHGAKLTDHSIWGQTRRVLYNAKQSQSHLRAKATHTYTERESDTNRDTDRHKYTDTHS